MDEIFIAQHLFEQRRYDDCIKLCDNILDKESLDQTAWLMKLRALIEKDFIDDIDLEEEGVAEILLDQNYAINDPSNIRPGTSLRRPLTTTGPSTTGSIRPLTATNRPMTGFARPGTSARVGTSSSTSRQALQSGRPGTSRPITVAGRQIRLGTQSMIMKSANDSFIDSTQVDIDKFSKRPALAMALCDYMLYIDHNPKKAIELALLCMRSSDRNWWWYNRAGKAYYQMGMLREAHDQYKLSMKQQEMVCTIVDLAKVFLRMDQPNNALSLYEQGLQNNPGEVVLHLGIGRVCQAINNINKADESFRKVLQWDASNIEAIATIAGHHFYNDQPEIALRFYRRLVQMGVNNTELWNNVGLSCFYCAQYDMALSCFEKALGLADDSNMADVWYNISHIAIGVGDLVLANQSLKIALSIDGNHAEAMNNLGVLELRKGNQHQACSFFEMASDLGHTHFEPLFNAALVADAVGDRQKCWNMVTKALTIFPEHKDSAELRDSIMKQFIMA